MYVDVRESVVYVVWLLIGFCSALFSWSLDHYAELYPLPRATTLRARPTTGITAGWAALTRDQTTLIGNTMA